VSAAKVVLVGGGHTHALVLAALRRRPLKEAEVVLVNPGPAAPYSGMLPGFVAGHYTRSGLEIDLDVLCRSAQVTRIDGAAISLDPEARQLVLADGRRLDFDVLSFDVGISTRMPALDGFAQHATPAKPLAGFAHQWADVRAGDTPLSLAVIGGGVAGAELAMAMAYARRVDGDANVQCHLVDRSDILSEVPPDVRAKLQKALARNGVQCHPDTAVASVNAAGLQLKGGGQINADFIVGAAGATPHPWLAQTDLALHQGSVRVDAHLQSSLGGVFAVGDCAHMDHAPRPKAGVYAVRQAPVLTANIRAVVAGKPLAPYHPQDDYLKLISLGAKSALGVYKGRPFSGPLVWRLKDWIDRRFMAQF